VQTGTYHRTALFDQSLSTTAEEAATTAAPPCHVRVFLEPALIDAVKGLRRRCGDCGAAGLDRMGPRTAWHSSGATGAALQGAEHQIASPAVKGVDVQRFAAAFNTAESPDCLPPSAPGWSSAAPSDAGSLVRVNFQLISGLMLHPVKNLSTDCWEGHRCTNGCSVPDAHMPTEPICVVTPMCSVRSS
jgi:hypothetical protein